MTQLVGCGASAYKDYSLLATAAQTVEMTCGRGYTINKEYQSCVVNTLNKDYVPKADFSGNAKALVSSFKQITQASIDGVIPVKQARLEISQLSTITFQKSKSDMSGWFEWAHCGAIGCAPDGSPAAKTAVMMWTTSNLINTANQAAWQSTIRDAATASRPQQTINVYGR
jgi:hypothetical protein